MLLVVTPSPRASSPPNRLPALASPKNTTRQNAGLQGAGSRMRRSCVCSRVARSSHHSGSTIEPAATTMPSSPCAVTLNPTGSLRLAPCTRIPIRAETKIVNRSCTNR